MTTHPDPTAVPRPAPAVAAAVLGLVGAALCAVMAFFLLALGGLTQDDGGGRWWFLALVAAVVAQAWGAVRLLRRRGWRLLALGSLPGLLPLVVLVVVWLEYRQDPTLLEVLASVPVFTLVLTLLPSVRRWADGRADRLPAGRAATTSSRA